MGYNFIKLLSPGESFQIIIMSNSRACEYYEERIVMITEKEFQKHFDKIPDFFLYKDNHIVITDTKTEVGL